MFNFGINIITFNHPLKLLNKKLNSFVMCVFARALAPTKLRARNGVRTDPPRINKWEKSHNLCIADEVVHTFDITGTIHTEHVRVANLVHSKNVAHLRVLVILHGYQWRRMDVTLC